jgi:hypothetical protein
MNTIRQYLKQKIARSYGAGRKVDLDDLKREIKDDVAHVLYDQTRRTPIVITVINEIASTPPNGIAPGQSQLREQIPQSI